MIGLLVHSPDPPVAESGPGWEMETQSRSLMRVAGTQLL